MNFKITTTLLGFSFIFFLFATHTTYAQSVQIDSDDLLIRSGPGTEHEPIGSANSGDTYPYLQSDAEWLEIEFNEAAGWVHEDFVSIIEQSSESPSFDNGDMPEMMMIPIDKVTLREDATVGSNRLRELTKHQTVTILESVDGWIQVETRDETVGYIPSWLLDVDQSDAKPINDQTIVIDPGHGGEDIGATGISGRYESEYALFTSYILQRQLELLGANVALTRTDDYYHALGPRPALSNYKHADAFISIHYNSEPNYPSANGMDTFYRDKIDEELALSVHDQLIETTDANDRGASTGNYQILRLSKRPSMLLELGFLSNQTEEERIQSTPYQYLISEGVIKGLLNP
ncbi:N-acetylmuramoyl-L-alanine amidase [Pelagirhabdus alkalitolerans]|uniref:N-acetylmuramoyl-L-alanine amidase n=1 Tax=Pelagirhabdus alkalitolerans TaxID=1612202 RepID=A0A1G6HRQ8_9BACI|nr:N-acetylmuramoyl-L-alanine amidase [Pelagirhabdus alkalitolerans]SDB96912.1 N-acetylmuramoyl-L-alanine amidase [Pelagirhabdus alkalitolerans]